MKKKTKTASEEISWQVGEKAHVSLACNEHGQLVPVIVKDSEFTELSDKGKKIKTYDY